MRKYKISLALLIFGAILNICLVVSVDKRLVGIVGKFFLSGIGISHYVLLILIFQRGKDKERKSLAKLIISIIILAVNIFIIIIGSLVNPLLGGVLVAVTFIPLMQCFIIGVVFFIYILTTVGEISDRERQRLKIAREKLK